MSVRSGHAGRAGQDELIRLRRGERHVRRAGLTRPRMLAGSLLLGLVVVVALAGPYLAPHGPSQIVGIPLTGAGVFGTDSIGRDVLSRVLFGGRELLLLAVLATAIGLAVATAAGLIAASSRSVLGGLVMRLMDVLLAFPPLLFLMVVATGAGHSNIALVLAVATVHVPSVARLVRAAALEQMERAFVEAAVLRGEGRAAILRREILPTIVRPFLADAGLRLTLSILLIAAVSFLGLGSPPPAANWALMVAENRSGLTLQPWAVVAPAALIALLTVGVNLIADSFSRSLDDRRGNELV